MEITITGSDKKLLQRISNLAIKLGLKVQIASGDAENIENTNQSASNKYNSVKAMEAMDELNKLNTFNEIKDPVVWQRNVRKDRNIFGNE